MTNDEEMELHYLGRTAHKFFMRMIWFLIFIVLLAFVSAALAAPRASSQEECIYVADMTLTARALTMEGLPTKTIRSILSRMYVATSAKEWVEAVLPYVARAKGGVQEVASEVVKTCMTTRGNLDGLFGIGS